MSYARQLAVLEVLTYDEEDTEYSVSQKDEKHNARNTYFMTPTKRQYHLRGSLLNELQLTLQRYGEERTHGQ